MECDLSASVIALVRDGAGGGAARGRRARERARDGKEAQRRGPVHAHYILGVESADELRAAKAFRRHLERLSRSPATLRARAREVREAEAGARSCRVSVELLPRRSRSQGQAYRGGTEPRAAALAAVRVPPADVRDEDNDAEQAPATSTPRVCRARGRRMPAWWSGPGDAGRRPLSPGVHVEARLQHATKLAGGDLGASP